MRILIAMAALGLAGCTMGPNFEKPTPWWKPASFDHHDQQTMAKLVSEPVPQPVDAAWWTLFGDPVLTGLEQRVAAGNLEVRAAELRLAEARAQLGLAGTAQFPVVNANANYTREAQSGRGVASLLGGSGSQATNANGLGGTTSGFPSTPSSPLSQPIDLYQYGFDASWELDLWGRVRRGVESASATVDASAESRNAVVVTTLAELARDYIQLRGAQAEQAIVQRNLDTAQSTLNLTRQRYGSGLTTELDVANQAAQVASTASLLPALQQQEGQLINAVSLLLGEAPGALRAELATAEPVPPVPPVVPIGLPSELTRRRPDIRQAEAQLHAATADVGVAVADFYPRFSLSASAALQSLQPQYLTDWGARTFGIGPSVTLPIFDGGRLTRTLELRQTQQKEAALQYQRTVLTALHDVDNALIAYSAEENRRTQLAQAVAQNRRALGLAQDRYSGGVGDFLTVLDTERRLLSTEQALNDSTTKVSTNLVQLYKALGGGWETAPIPPPPAPDATAKPAKAA